MPNALTLDNRINSYASGVLSSFITELSNTLSVHERSYQSSKYEGCCNILL